MALVAAAEVVARRERRAVAPDDHHLDVVVRVALLQGLDDRPTQRVEQRVALLRAIHGHPLHLGQRVVDEDQFFSHGMSFRSCREGLSVDQYGSHPCGAQLRWMSTRAEEDSRSPRGAGRDAAPPRRTARGAPGRDLSETARDRKHPERSRRGVAPIQEDRTGGRADGCRHRVPARADAPAPGRRGSRCPGSPTARWTLPLVPILIDRQWERSAPTSLGSRCNPATS